LYNGAAIPADPGKRPVVEPGCVNLQMVNFEAPDLFPAWLCAEECVFGPPNAKKRGAKKSVKYVWIAAVNRDRRLYQRSARADGTILTVFSPANQ
jgi:hypothetical protein